MSTVYVKSRVLKTARVYLWFMLCSNIMWCMSFVSYFGYWFLKPAISSLQCLYMIMCALYHNYTQYIVCNLSLVYPIRCAYSALCYVWCSRLWSSLW